MDWILFIIRQRRGLAGESNKSLTIASVIKDMIKGVYGPLKNNVRILFSQPAFSRIQQTLKQKFFHTLLKNKVFRTTDHFAFEKSTLLGQRLEAWRCQNVPGQRQNYSTDRKNGV
jgi:hypothetical protein